MEIMMNNLTKKFLSQICLFALSFLYACSPSEEEINATQSQVADDLSHTQTASVPTYTLTPSPTLTVTPSPTPTPTTTPTPTPIPEPDPKAMIHWEELELPPGFLSISPDAIGIGEGDTAVSRQLGDGTVVTYTIEGGFVFADEWPEGMYGYTALFPTDSDKEFYDEGILNIVNDMKSLVIYGLQSFDFSELKDIPNASGIGDLSAGAEITYTKMGKTYRFYYVKFRIDDIGGSVFLRHEASEAPVIRVSDLARIYAQSILNPMHTCKLTSASPVENESWPTYNIRAEGFYPGETRAIALAGDVLINGEKQSVVTALMGLEGQSANNRGRITERVAFQSIEGEDIIPPSEIEIKILGYHSGCLIIDELTWPSTTQGSIPDPLSTPIGSPSLGEQGNPIVWGIVPETDVNVMVPAMEQAAEIITERTGIVVETLLLDNYSQLVNRLCSGEVHFGALSVFSYLLAVDRGCAQGALTAEMRGDTSYLGQILVHRNSGISSVADLAGVVFCRTSPESMSSWIIPSLMMRTAGLDPENDLVEIVDTVSSDDVISAIYNGECDAGATYVDARIPAQGEFPDVLDVVHVLTETIQIPFSSITFSPDVPADIRIDLKHILENLEVINAGQILDDLYGWEGIQESDDALYAPLRRLIDASGVDIESFMP
jgi:phosphonate transport system substrate-binding protein